MTKRASRPRQQPLRVFVLDREAFSATVDEVAHTFVPVSQRSRGLSAW